MEDAEGASGVQAGEAAQVHEPLLQKARPSPCRPRPLHSTRVLPAQLLDPNPREREQACNTLALVLSSEIRFVPSLAKAGVLRQLVAVVRQHCNKRSPPLHVFQSGSYARTRPQAALVTTQNCIASVARLGKNPAALSA
jgi:hypothetical protein